MWRPTRSSGLLSSAPWRDSGASRNRHLMHSKLRRSSLAEPKDMQRIAARSRRSRGAERNSAHRGQGAEEQSRRTCGASRPVRKEPKDMQRVAASRQPAQHRPLRNPLRHQHDEQRTARTRLGRATTALRVLAFRDGPGWSISLGLPVTERSASAGAASKCASRPR
jgi:hypothetical protein